MKLYNKDDLKDSRIFFDKQPPNFMTIFIIFITLCLLMIVCFSFFVSKSSIIKGEGIVNTTDNRYVSMNTNGVVISINKNEGDYVNKGDVIFTISNGKENEQLTVIQPQIDQINEKIKALDIFDKSLNENINYLQNSGSQQAYYGKMEYYLSTIESEKYTSEGLNENISNTKEKIETLKKEKIELENQLNNMHEEEIENGKKEEINSKIESKINEIKTEEDSLKQFNNQLHDPTSQAAQIKQQLLSELGSERQTTKEQLALLEGQKQSSEIGNSINKVRADNNGYLHYLMTFKEGLAVQTNQTVAEISTNENENLIIEANISATDISKIKVGQNANIEIKGINVQKYGTIKGKIEKISNGTFTQETQQGNIVYYQCIISISSTSLSSSKGEKIELIKSMPIEARVIYNKETYFEWFMELINLQN